MISGEVEGLITKGLGCAPRIGLGITLSKIYAWNPLNGTPHRRQGQLVICGQNYVGNRCLSTA